MKRFVLVSVLGLLLTGASCSSNIKQQQYAKLRQERTFEYEFPVVWGGIQKALRDYKIKSADPTAEEANTPDLKKRNDGEIETDWVIGQSRDKYIEYQVNDLPKKKYLQMRFRFIVKASRVLGGTHVVVQAQEELEKLDEAGNPDGYETSDEPDSSRANDVLERINLALLSAAP